jgi:hypothetical protein
MPTSFLSADAGFPRLTSDIPQEERLNRIENYLYMLLEQLKYALYNLGKDNFNETDLKDIEEDISGPIMSVVSDMQGNISSLQQTAEGLYADMYGSDGKVSQLELTAAGLSLDMYDPTGKVATIEATASGITTRLNDFDGSGSTIEQTASSLTTRVTDAEGNITVAQQTADKIDWIVASGTSASNMTLTSEAIDLVAQGINITGYVTFNSLETAGSSVINGDNVELKADADGDSVSYLTYTSANGNTFAQIHTLDNRTGTTLTADRYAFVIETPRTVDGDFCALKLISGDSMSLESGWQLFMKATSQVVINNGLLATRIQANNVSYVSGDQNYPADCYIFASDGIYYGGQRILAT